MRKILSAVLCLAIAAGLTAGFTACGNNRTDVAGGVVVVNNGDRIYAEGADPSSLSVIDIGFTEAGLGREWLVEIAKSFVLENKEYEIDLEGDPSLASSLKTKLESGKNLSDLYFPLNSAWENYASRGWLEPLDDVYSEKVDGENGKTIEEKTDANYKDYARYKTNEGSHYYIMPWNDTVTGIVYNVKMFGQYGWEIPETTDELEELCKKILADTNGKVKPFAYPGKIGGYFDYIGMTWWMQASGVDGVKKFFEFDSPEIYNATEQPAVGKKQALEEFLRFYAPEKGYCIPGSMGKDHTSSQMDFIGGASAMILNANWLECEMKTNMSEDFTMGMMSVPYISTAKKDENGNYVKVNYTAPPDYIFIPKGAANKSGAKKFLAYMQRDDMLALYTKITGSPRPFGYDLTAIEGLSKFNDDVMKIRSESATFFDYSRAGVYMYGYAQKYIGGQPYSALIRGETTPLRFCNVEYVEADNNWDDWVAKSNL